MAEIWPALAVVALSATCTCSDRLLTGVWAGGPQVGVGTMVKVSVAKGVTVGLLL